MRALSSSHMLSFQCHENKISHLQHDIRLLYTMSNKVSTAINCCSAHADSWILKFRYPKFEKYCESQISTCYVHYYHADGHIMAPTLKPIANLQRLPV